LKNIDSQFPFQSKKKGESTEELQTKVGALESSLAQIVTVNFNNYATFEAAIAALPSGGDIFFPKGNYTRADKLNVPENICFVSNGDAYINAPIRIHKAENIFINNLYIEKRSDYIYNKKSFEKFKQEIAKAENEVVNIVALGDSITYGQVSSDEQHKSWAGLLKTYLTKLFGSAGFGYYLPINGGVPIYKEGTNMKTHYFTPSGSNAGLGTFKFKDLEVIKGLNTDGGTMVLTIDGVNYNINCQGASRQYGVHQLVYTGTEEKEHTLSIAKPSTGTGYFEALNLITNNKGVRVHQIGHVGLRGNEYTDAAATASITAFNPKLTIIALGMNDFIQQTSVSEYRNSLDMLIQKGKANNGTVILLNYNDSNDGGATYTLSGHYRQQMMELSAQHDCVLVDIDKKWITFANADTLGFLDSVNGVHPYDPGHKDIFESFKVLFDECKPLTKEYVPSFLTESAKTLYYKNEYVDNVVSDVNKLISNIDYSGFNKGYNLFKDSNADGLADGMNQNGWGDNTGNTMTSSITSIGQKATINITNTDGGLRYLKSFSGIEVGKEYLLFVKFRNGNPVDVYQILDDFSGTTQVSTSASAADVLIAVKRTATNTSHLMYLTKALSGTGTHTYEIEMIGVFDIALITQAFGVDFTKMSAEVGADLLVDSISKALTNIKSEFYMKDSTGKKYIVKINTGGAWEIVAV
jgi:lysophospholipase L1-like esterase